MRRCTSTQRYKPNTVWLSPQHLDGKWATIYPEWPHAHHQCVPIWHYRPRALQIRRSGCAWARPRAGPRATWARAAVIYMPECPGLAQAACGLRRPAHSQVHAHMHFACAARVAIAHVHVASESAPPFLAARPGFLPPLHRGI